MKNLFIYLVIYLTLIGINSYAQYDLGINVSPHETPFNTTPGGNIRLDISYSGSGPWTTINQAIFNFKIQYYLKISGADVLIYEDDFFGAASLEYSDWSGEEYKLINIPCSIPTGNYLLSYKIIDMTYSSDGGGAPSYTISSTNINTGMQEYCQDINCTLNNISQINITSSTPNLSISTTSTNLSCSMSLNGTATVSATGGTGSYTYKWSNNSTSQTIVFLTDGIYSVTVNSGDRCQTSTVTITRPAEIVIAITSTGALCGGDGSATASASGGTSPYTYMWNTSPQQTTATASNLNAENYIVTVRDANSCYKTQDVYINTRTPDIKLSDYPSGYYYLISNNEIWTASSNPFGNVNDIVVDQGIRIFVDENQTLTLKDLTIKFKDNSGIFVIGGSSTVKRGGKLIVDNSTLTSTCDNMWNGIYLSGNNTFPQTPLSSSIQPIVYFKNNSIIKNAIFGIESTHGGLIFASNSSFINNVISVYMNLYTLQNYSSFNNCIFETNSQLNTSISTYYPYIEHVNLYNVQDIKFNYCTFRSDNPIMNSRKVRGIKSYNSSFKIAASCSVLLPFDTPCPEVYTQKSSFTNLYYGIKASNGSYINVDKCDFINNERGAYIKAINNATVTRNNFDVGDGQTEPNYGLYMHGCTGYKIEENNFINGIAGMFINNSGNTSNIVYNNKFENLSASNAATAAIALDINSNYWDNYDEDYDDPTTYIGNKEGLQFKCNKFNNNEYSLAVIDGNIAWYQGNNSIDPTQLAGNTFTHNNPYVDSDFYLYNTAGSMFEFNQKYKYFQHNSYETKLLYYTSSKINGYTMYVPYIESKACPSSFVNKKSISVSSAEYELQKIQTDINTMEYDLQKAVDNGNKQLLLDLISSVEPNTFNTLCTELISSQYLSDEVLEAFIGVPINGQYNRKTDVLLKNSPLPEKIKPILATITYPQHFIDLLMLEQNGINPREQNEGEILALKNDRSKLLTDITIESVNNDSVPEVKDSLIDLLKKEVDYRTNITLIPLLINEERYAETDVQLDLLQSQIHSLPQSKQSEINDWIQLQQIVKQVNYKTLDQLREVVKENMGFLEKLALQENKMGCETAQVLIEESQYGNYYEPIKLPSANNPKSMQINNQGTKTNVNYNTIDIYPNPATNLINIDTDENINNSIVKIYNTLGVLVKETNLTDVYSIDVSDLSKGIYMLHVYSSNEHFTKLIKIIK